MRSFVGRQLVNRHRERLDATRSIGPRQGLPADLQTSVPTDGSSGRSKHSGDNLGQKESSSSLLLVVAQIKDLENGQCHRETCRYVATRDLPLAFLRLAKN